jgi:hypothetical protein
MFKNSYPIYRLFGCIVLGIIALLPTHAAHALKCSPVAQIVNTTKALETVRIQRAESGKNEPASQYNRVLCQSDVVLVPKSISELKIRYELDNPPTYRTLKPGTQYWVSCGGSDICCKFMEFVMNYRTTPDKSDSDNSRLFMPLAADEGLEYPFYLFAGKAKGTIPLFWYNGQAPYQLTVTDATGKVVREKTEVAYFSLTLPNTAPGSEYTLTIQSHDEQSVR